MGRNRENQVEAGRVNRADVIHHAPWRTPASECDSPISSEMKGRNRPKVKEVR